MGRWEARAIFGLSSALYLVVAALLAFRYDSFNLDAVSRQANAYYMFFSRDPHLAAIGFVWNPLPSFLDIPLILLKPVWPSLVTRAFAAYVIAALFMAGSVAVMAGCLADFGVTRINRWVITALYALHPMILYYGGNGMSEGIFLFTLMLGCRYLVRWIYQPDLKSLILSGTAFGLAYLARNEAAFPAALGCGVVAIITYARSAGALRRRVLSATTDAVIFSAPFTVSFVGWAVTSWIIVGSPFEQFSSIYGTTSQLRAMREAGTLAAHGSSHLVVRQLLALEPMVLLVVITGCLLMMRRHDARVLAPLVAFGGVLSFAVIASLGGKTAGFFRYNITEVPLVCLLTGAVVCRVRLPTGRVLRWASLAGAPMVAIALLAPAFPITFQTMMDNRTGTEEATNLSYIVHPGAGSGPASETGSAQRWQDVSHVAHHLDALKLPHGSILVDNFTECIPELIMNSKDPQKFVIPNDRDYERVLADPATFHGSYFLVPPATGGGSINAVNRAYPDMYANGSGIAELVREFTPAGCDHWRLYRLKSAVPAPSGTPAPAPRGNS